jgi:hypothetical protein
VKNIVLSVVTTLTKPPSFVGFGGATMTPSPPVGFNLTFACPDRQVFESDWLAIPFVMMTCQVGPFQRDNLIQSCAIALFCDFS